MVTGYRDQRSATQPVGGSAPAPYQSPPTGAVRRPARPPGAGGVFAAALIGSLLGAGIVAVIAGLLRPAPVAVVASAPVVAAPAPPSPPEPTVVPEQTTRVPDVGGLGLEAAKQVLRSVGLDVGDLTYVTSDRPAHSILAQDPAAGREAPLRTVVALDVVDAPVRVDPTEAVEAVADQVEIPPVRALPAAKGRAKLEALGFRVALRKLYHPTLTTGKCISTKPARGALAAHGALVYLFVVE